MAETIEIINNASQSIWITIYDVAKTQHLDWGCINGTSSRMFAAGQYTLGSYYHVRTEVKESAQCGGKTICDTSIQIRCTTHNVVGLYCQSDGTNCWLKQE
ncbi:hypothetical protein HH214_00355 [Mucilaginibacter robiniae]|uniref:Uncharacterized protein n=1 Tax=Mucilaginibacter robiniae TaxID=2728022 RepID=A0A7L5DW21_9SPHI|nr:hypothetical protein [Mucilaginibacter robiniae]QJD94428.1 hypothetical protein HH214_00355 [Mucilaginibacter robiniae]